MRFLLDPAIAAALVRGRARGPDRAALDDTAPARGRRLNRAAPEG